MKGPYERLKYDLRRVWECPLCHHHERTTGAATVWWCDCPRKEDGPARPMKLLEDGVRRVLPTPPIAPDAPDAKPAAAP